MTEEYWPGATREHRSGSVADGHGEARCDPRAIPSTRDMKAGSIPAGPALKIEEPK